MVIVLRSWTFDFPMTEQNQLDRKKQVLIIYLSTFYWVAQWNHCPSELIKIAWEHEVTFQIFPNHPGRILSQILVNFQDLHIHQSKLCHKAVQKRTHINTRCFELNWLCFVLGRGFSDELMTQPQRQRRIVLPASFTPELSFVERKSKLKCWRWVAIKTLKPQKIYQQSSKVCH